MKTFADGKNEQIFVDSEQINIYEKKHNRITFSSLYESERHSLEKVLSECTSVIDIGCLNGDTLAAIKEKYDVSCCGIDIDSKGIEVATQRYSDILFYVGDFMDSEFLCEKADLVFAFNLFDHFENWKAALNNLKRFSNRFINISTLMRLDGPTLIDPETNFIYYSKGNSRLLWAVHNVFELAAYAATEHINATSIYVYCYTKYDHDRFQNVQISKRACHALSPNDLIVGNVIIEFDDKRGMQKTKDRPDLKIVKNGKVVFDSPWHLDEQR